MAATPRTVKSFEAMPAELKALTQWCVWKLEIKKGNLTKVPYQPSGYNSDSTDSTTWATFEACMAAYEDEALGFAGVGFFFNDDYTGVDFDHCLTENSITSDGLKVIDELSMGLLQTLNSYTEISQSGTGLHSIIKAIKPKGSRCKKGNYEMYSRDRFFVMTGNVAPNVPTEIRADQAAMEFAYAAIFEEDISDSSSEKPRPANKPISSISEIGDDALILKAKMAKNGNDFNSLWNGSTLGYSGDDSAADMALMNHLAFWTRGDAGQMERLFSRSGLGHRDKWKDRQDYRERTIQKAISDAAEFYEPPTDEGNGQEDRNAELLKARELLKDLPEKIKADVNIIKEPAILKALAIIKEMDRIDYDLKLDSVKKANKALKVKSINATVEEHISNGAFDSEERKSPLEIVSERIPEWIETHHFKTVADTERIYHYDRGVYLDDGEKVLKALIEAEFSDITTDAVVRDVIGKVKRRTYVDRDAFNNQHLLNVKNGLINLDTLELKPHTHDYLSTAQLEVSYNPEAKAPKTQKFLGEVAQFGDIELIKELIGWLLWPDYHIHKAVMLLGPGRNGKGTLLRLITAFLGGRNISNVTLQDLVSDRFAKADLYGKLANIGGDLPSKDLSDTAAFRNLTGGDDVRAQEKYKTAFGFRNKAKMLFSANVLPRSPDDTYAFYSRWILLEFLNLFTIENGKADPDLDAKLQTPEELSGLLNIALAGLKRLRENGWKFSYEKTVEDVEVMYKRNANPVFAFLIDECEPGGATDHIEKTVFWNRFNDYIKKHNLRPISSTRFSELLKDQTEIPVSTYRLWVERGDRPWCWQGVKFKKGEISEVFGHKIVSRPSRVLPTPSLAGEKENERGIDEEIIKDGSKVGITPSVDGLDTSIKAEKHRADEQTKAKEGYLVRILATENKTEDKNKFVWDTSFGSITELIKGASGNHKLTVALVRSRANSLGFKTAKGWIQGDQKRRITCEKSVFENLKKRYIPDQDDQDDQDDREGPEEVKRAEPAQVNKDSACRVSSSGGVRDRPDRPDRPASLPLDGIKTDLQRANEQAKAKEEHFKTPSSSKVRWTDDQPKPEKKRKQCLMCGKDPEGHSFIQYYNNGVSGWLCTSCSMGQTTTTEPVKPDFQTTLNANVEEEART